MLVQGRKGNIYPTIHYESYHYSTKALNMQGKTQKKRQKSRENTTLYCLSKTDTIYRVCSKHRNVPKTKNSRERRAPGSKIWLILAFVIQHTVAIALKVGVGHLLLEFLADALVFLGFGQAAGAVAVLGLQPGLDAGHDLLVLVQSNSHSNFLLALHESVFIIPKALP